MQPPREQHAKQEIVDTLAEVLGRPPKTIRVRHGAGAGGCDFLISSPGHRFLVEYKNVASAGPLAPAIQQLRCYAQAARDNGVPLIVVPFMGPVGQRLCDDAGVSWLDLSGNANIVAPGLRILVQGKPNKYVARGRPPNVFAPKSSRVARQLLHRPKQFQTQAEIARETELDDGYVSKIARRLEQEHYLDADEHGAVRPRDPDLLLDAWHDAYDFNRHRIIKGHVPTRSSEELLHKLAKQLNQVKMEYAVTGLAAAWLLIKFAAFRLATIYLSSTPPRSMLAGIEFVEEPRGANLWFVVPDDVGVFRESRRQAGIRCVSPVQAYLDLKDQPERAKDAAIELRKKLLDWGRHGT